MALKEFRGDAAAVAEVRTVQITGNDAATTYTLTITGTGKSVSVSGNASGANNTATDLAAAWNASTVAEFAEITASAATDTVTLSHDTAGVTFSVTSSVSGGSGTIGSVAVSTAANGPNVWSAANFGGTLPADSDDVVIRGSKIILYGLDQSSIQPATLQILDDDNGNAPTIGLPLTNAAGYPEYRDRFLKIGPASLTIENTGARCNIDTGTDQVAVVIEQGTVNLRGSHASSTCYILGGSVTTAADPGSTAQFATLAASGGQVEVGSGTTLATARFLGSARAEVKCGTTTLELQESPTVVTSGSGAVTTADVQGGTLDYRSSGTVTALNCGGGTLDARKNLAGFTVTNATLSRGATIDDSANRINWANPYVISNGSLSDITHKTGRGVTVLVAAS